MTASDWSRLICCSSGCPGYSCANFLDLIYDTSLWSDSVIKLVSVLFGKCTTLVVTKF